MIFFSTWKIMDYQAIADRVKEILDPMFHHHNIQTAGTQADGKPVAKVEVHCFEDTFCNLWDLFTEPEIRAVYMRSIRRIGPEEKTRKLVVSATIELSL